MKGSCDPESLVSDVVLHVVRYLIVTVNPLTLFLGGSRDGAGVRGLVSQFCCLGSIPCPGITCDVSGVCC